MLKPLCFVLMPFGKKPDAAGRMIDFDAVYRDIIAPAVSAAAMEPLRADEERNGGIIHKPMFERLILCKFAVADLTTANANVFYELGVRHAIKPHTTVLMFHPGGGQLPFDVALLRALPYAIGPDGQPSDASNDSAKLLARLQAERGEQQPGVDSPLFQLLENYPNVAHEKTDVFRAHVSYAAQLKQQLEDIRSSGAARAERLARLEQWRAALGQSLDEVETGVLVDLLLSYRGVDGWTQMEELYHAMPEPLQRTVMVREQYAFALNRSKQGKKAEQVLLGVISEHGPSSETYGLLGRVYKDQWQQAAADNQAALATGLLDKAIQAYRRGFEADWRDAYPGINAVTLMECHPHPDPQRHAIRPVVEYAVARRIAMGTPDYWDLATQLELAVLAQDGAAINRYLSSALALLREDWERATTLRNLRLIWSARSARGESSPERAQVEAALSQPLP